MRCFLRDPIESDWQYIAASTIRGMHSAHGLHVIPAGWALVRALASDLIRRSDCVVMCAHDDLSHIVGYALSEGGEVLHWVHVKGGLGIRRQGLGTSLVSQVSGETRPLVVSQTSSQLRPGLQIWRAWRCMLDSRLLESSVRESQPSAR